VLYGVGARLDEKTVFLFALRGVDENQLLANAGLDSNQQYGLLDAS